MPTSARTACSTSAAARCRTGRSSPPSPPPTSASTRSPTRWRSCRARSRRFPVEDGSFDVVLCAQVLEHVDDPAAWGARAAPRHRSGWPRAPLHARRHGLPPEPRRPLAVDATPGWSDCSRTTASGRPLGWTPASGSTACVAMLASIYLDHVFRRAHLAPSVAAVRLRPEPGRGDDRPARRRVAGAASRARSRPTTTSWRRSPRDRRARHRGRWVHRLQPRPRPARARRHRARARQLLHGLPRQPRRPDGRRRDGGGRPPLATSASTRRCAGSRSCSTRARSPSVPRSVQDPLTTTAVNVEGTLNVLLAARDEGVRRVVSASSSSVYGNTGTLPRTEDQAPDPISPVCGREARRRALLHELQPRLLDGERLAAVLQRLRAAAGPELAVRGGRAALHQRDRRGAPGHDPRRRRAVP